MERVRRGRNPTSLALTSAALARKETEEFNIQATHALVDHVIEHGGPLLRGQAHRETVKRRQRRENGSLHDNIAELLGVSRRTLRHYQSQPSAAREAEREAAWERVQWERVQRCQRGNQPFPCGDFVGSQEEAAGLAATSGA